MTKQQIKIVNTETGEEIVREANAEEIAQIELDASSYVEFKAKAAARATQREAILERLGITAEEAKLLLS